MKNLHVVLGVVLFVLLVTFSAIALGMASVSQDAWSAALDTLKRWRAFVIVVSLLHLILGVLFVYTGVRRPEYNQLLTFESDGGAVSISLRAVTDFLSRLSEEFAAVLEIKPIVRIANDALDIEADVRVRSGAQIPELCKVLQDRMRESIRDNLGFADVRSVKINVRDIARPPAGKAPEKA